MIIVSCNSFCNFSPLTCFLTVHFSSRVFFNCLCVSIINHRFGFSVVSSNNFSSFGISLFCSFLIVLVHMSRGFCCSSRSKSISSLLSVEPLQILNILLAFTVYLIISFSFVSLSTLNSSFFKLLPCGFSGNSVFNGFSSFSNRFCYLFNCTCSRFCCVSSCTSCYR